MSDGHGQQTSDATTLAHEWREVRALALEVAAGIPETRVYRSMERAGWTLKHELSHLAAVDAEVLHLLEAARSGAGTGLDAVTVRRRRGQAMHHAQDMRLTPLREHLADLGEQTARAIEDAGDALSSALDTALDASEDEARTLAEHLRKRLGAAREGVEAVRGIIGG